MSLPQWADGLQRLVLVLSIRGDMLARSPQAVRPEPFGGGGSLTTLTSPRQRLATLIADYWEKYSARPSPEAMDQLVVDERRRLGPAEGDVLLTELSAVLATEIPADVAWVYDRAAEWASYRKLEDGLVRAADLLRDGGTGAVDAAREVVTRAAEPDDVGNNRQTVTLFQGDFEERVRLWRLGDAYGERIPTGLPALDAALQGGPTRREVYYFLAPPKGAKTTCLLRVALGAARRRFGVYVVTYEMQALRMALRMDRALSRQTKRELADDTFRLEATMRNMRLTGEEIVIEEAPAQRAGAVEAAVRRVERIRREGGKVDVVCFDYLNIMGSSKVDKEKRHELARVSRDMATAAKELNVLVWSAALVNRAAVNKRVIRKTDIAEAFEVIAVADGMIAVCGTPEMVRNGVRRLWVAASREEADEVLGGDYTIDFSKMAIDPIDSSSVDQMIVVEDSRG